MPYTKIDRVLLILVLCLVILGLIFVYSSSYYRAMRQGEDSTFYLVAHLKRVAVGIAFLLLGMIIPYERLKKLLLPLLFLSTSRECNLCSSSTMRVNS